MKARPLATICMTLLLCASINACGRPASPPAPSDATSASTAAPSAQSGSSPSIDMNVVAERVVTQSAGIKAGDVVRISGTPRDLELLESLAVYVRKVGAHPLLTVGTEKLAKRLFVDVSESRDSDAPEADLRVGSIVDAWIAVDGVEDPNLFADVDPKRLSARAAAGLPLNDRLLKRNVKVVEIGNGLYPTEWRARRFGLSQAELHSAFWNGINVDYSSLQQKGKELAEVIAGGRQFHITSPSGTDLRAQREGGSVFVSDGIISSEDVKKGGPSVSLYLPAGEVATAVVPGTATGKVVAPLYYFQGQQVDNLQLVFNGGKLVSMTGSGPGFARLKATYDASGPGKELFAFVDLGINPNVRLGAETKLSSWVPAGTVTLGTGDNTWAGGTNSSAGGVTVSLPGCTVTLDGTALVEKGRLKL